MVDRRLSDSEVQDLGDLSSDQVTAKVMKLKETERVSDIDNSMSNSKMPVHSYEERMEKHAFKDKPSNVISSGFNLNKVMKEESASQENEHAEDHVELGSLDQEAVEIIVMGSNSNSVVNVLNQVNNFIIYFSDCRNVMCVL